VDRLRLKTTPKAIAEGADNQAEGRMYFCQRVEDNAFHLLTNVTSHFDEIRRPQISSSALSFHVI
jgi:hypothetical protein